jgi:hypothetical protein
MEKFLFGLQQRVYEGCGDYRNEEVEVKVTIEEIRTENGQPGVVVILDGLGDRKMGVSLKHPAEKPNFWREVRYAIFRLGLKYDDAKEVLCNVYLQALLGTMDQVRVNDLCGLLDIVVKGQLMANEYQSILDEDEQD